MKNTQILLLLIPAMLFGGGTSVDQPNGDEEGWLKVSQDQVSAFKTLYDSADAT